MSEGAFDWKPVGQISACFLKATFGFGLGLLSWQFYTPQTFLFGLISGCAFFGAAMRMAEGSWKTYRLVARERKLARYRRQGATPKADKMAGEDDLRARGLVK